MRTLTADGRSYELTVGDDAMIMAMWNLKLNTLEIAHKLKRPEWQIANRLLHLRDEAAASQRGN